MKEFLSQTGGRFTYTDDFINLQELALAIEEIFAGCDNFIVTGCEVSGNTITEGLVYLNGKLRRVNKTENITVWPQYIYESNEYKNVPYASGGDKIGRAEYGALVGSALPTDPVKITNTAAQYITVAQATGGRRMKDAWFGKYALILDSVSGNQTVNGIVNVTKLNSSTDIIATSNGQIKVVSSYGNGKSYFNGSSFMVEAQYSGKTFQLAFNNATNSFNFILNGVTLGSISSTAVTFSHPLSCAQISGGNTRIDNNGVYQHSGASDTTELRINYYGYNGGSNYFRTTVIGNGKGSAILTVQGSTSSVSIAGKLSIYGNFSEGLTLKGTYTKSNNNYQQGIIWRDSADEQVARIGFYSTADNILSIRNYTSEVEIRGVNYVNIAPIIKEGGVSLADKYASKTTTETELGKKALKADTYTKTETDSTFAKKTGGLSQFITGSNTAAILRSQIGAIASSDITGFAKLNQCLADMATTDALKKQIRDNIGAAAKTDIPSTKDTDWKQISGTNLYARQIGKVVCIQGLMTTVHSGTAFNIPNTIDPPAYCVGISVPTANKTWYGLHVHGGSRAVYVTHCNACSQTVPISITYMAN